MALDLAQSFRIDPSELPSQAIIFGCTEGMREVRNKIARVSQTDLPVLIRGESGTGKEIIARYLHMHSQVHQAPFVKLNCAAIPVHLLESELLGYEKGAFTGAQQMKRGLVEIANGGTLFLDEIGDMEASLQTKLLHLLQDGRYARIGGREDLQARVRVICATNCDLETAVGTGAFRQDLFYRIDVISLQLPPLRKRREDLPALSQHFIEKLSAKFKKSAPPLTETTLHLMAQWRWPGNIRELESWIARYIILGSGEALSAELGRQVVLTNRSCGDKALIGHLKVACREAALATERAVILKVLQANQWSRRKTAKELNMSYRSLLYKLRDAGVPHRRSCAPSRISSADPGHGSIRQEHEHREEHEQPYSEA